jgi:hypothetical protein
MLSKTTALLTVGVAYAMGIVVALVVCSATSGGHFSPAVTIVHVIFNGFPIAQGARSAQDSFEKKYCILTHDYEDTSFLRYLVASPPVCLCTGNGGLSSRSSLLYQQDEHSLIISAGGRGGAHCHKQVRRCELHEPWSRWHLRTVLQSCRPSRPSFFERIGIGMVPSSGVELRGVNMRPNQDFFIGIVIAACLDPTNFFAPPAAAPWIIGLT